MKHLFLRNLFALMLAGVLCTGTSTAQEILSKSAKDSIVTLIKSQIKGVKIKEIDCAKPYLAKFELMVPQLLDHTNPNSDTLWELVYLSHRSFDAPTVIVTEGYGAGYAESANYNEELCKILKANLVFAEHRYFGKSIPSPLNWDFMTLKQAADDHHQIIQWLKPLYPQKWVATGTSKGGSTSLYLKAYYPKDVDAVVAYVAPITNAQEDERPIDFVINRAGTKQDRQVVYDYQLLMLKNFDKLLEIFNEYASKYKLTYPMGTKTTLEYLILEYPFSHWQWGIPTNKVPTAKSSTQEMFDHILKVVDPYGFSETGSKDISPYYYQAYSEIGYYNYNAYIPIFKKWLKLSSYSNSTMIPKGAKAVYHPESHRKVLELLNETGEHIMQIHGEYDPWYQASWTPENSSKSAIFVLPKGNHGVRITYFDEDTRNRIYDTLEKWLDMKVRRL